jgi:predicted lipid-binding transport protein (Tim44 family)
MKKFLVTMMIALTTTAMTAEAFAKPLGGGRSFGRQSQNVQRQAPPAAPAAAPTAGKPAAAPGAAAGAGAAAATAAKPSMWKGLLGGALLGLGLGALLSHFGIGGAFASAIAGILMVLLLVGAVVFIIRMVRRKDTPANVTPFNRNQQPAFAGGASSTPEIGANLNNQPQAFQAQQPAATGGATWTMPAEFDRDGFVRQAKSTFIRMQAAWDKGDVNDLREFTTPEVFAELRMQIGERAGANDFTDVVQIDAQVLGVENVGREYMASVKFTGMIKTSAEAQPEHFQEVWNMTKPVDGSGGWLLAGIQQLS